MARCDFSPDPRARSGPGIWAPPEPRDPGWRADFLLNAYTQAQEARFQDIGKALVEDIDRQLKAHVTSQQQTIAMVLGRFFDPKDGQVTQRLAGFVGSAPHPPRQPEFGRAGSRVYLITTRMSARNQSNSRDATGVVGDADLAGNA